MNIKAFINRFKNAGTRGRGGREDAGDAKDAGDAVSLFEKSSAKTFLKRSYCVAVMAVQNLILGSF